MSKPEDELRVVEENDASAEEVVRLDAPKKKPIKKQGKMAAEALRPITEEEKQVASESVGGASGKWVEEFEGEEEKVIPIGWFFLVGLILLAVVAWMFFQIVSENDDGGRLGEPGLERANFAEDFNNLEGRELALEHFQEMEAALAGFLGAKSLEERAKFIRHPDRVVPLMEDYYKREEFRTFKYQEMLNNDAVSLDMLPFMAVQAKTEDGTNPPVLLEDSPDGILVDWESFVCYQPITPEQYAAERPLEPTTMRAYGTIDNFFVYEFSDEEKYGCLRLEFRDSDIVLFGYVELGSVVEQKFNQIMGGEQRPVRQPLILRLRFREDSPEKRCVIVEDVQSALWAFPRNPDEDVKAD